MTREIRENVLVGWFGFSYENYRNYMLPWLSTISKHTSQREELFWTWTRVLVQTHWPRAGVTGLAAWTPTQLDLSPSFKKWTWSASTLLHWPAAKQIHWGTDPYWFRQEQSLGSAKKHTPARITVTDIRRKFANSTPSLLWPTFHRLCLFHFYRYVEVFQSVKKVKVCSGTHVSLVLSAYEFSLFFQFYCD